MDVKIGVIGYGARATGLAALAHQPGNGSRVEVIYDPSPMRREAAREEFGAEVAYVDSLDHLFAHRLDAVMVLSPDFDHARSSIAALEQGLAVFCEKPMAITIEDTDRMLQVAHDKRARLYIGHNMRHMPVIRQMKRLIDEGAIGTVRSIWCRHFVGSGGDFYFHDWHAERAKGTGLLLQKGAHDIDVIHWLAGGYTRQVAGLGELMIYGDITDRRDNSDRQMWDWFDHETWPPTAQRELNPVIDVEDISMLQMRLDNGVLASYQQCHFTPDYWRNYTVIGDAGRLENLGDVGGDQIHVWTHREFGRMKPDLVEVIERPAGSHAGADPALIAEFVRFVRDGGQTDTSPVAAREAVATGVRGTESIRTTGGLLDVPALPDALRAYFDAGQS